LLSSFTQYYWIKLSLIVQDSALLAKKPGPCLSSSVADHSLKSTKNQGLCEPLPHQQPNSTKAHLITKVKGRFSCFTHPFARL